MLLGFFCLFISLLYILDSLSVGLWCHIILPIVFYIVLFYLLFLFQFPPNCANSLLLIASDND